VTPRSRDTAAQAAGDRGEERAAHFLMRQGLRILGRNYRTRQGEIDLIAADGPVLVFVEVRMRSAARFGDGAESVDFSKRRRLIAAARHYLLTLGREPACRFDVVSLERDAPTWIRAAFETN